LDLLIDKAIGLCSGHFKICLNHQIVQKGVVLKYSRKTTKPRGLSANFCPAVFLPSGKQLGGGLAIADPCEEMHAADPMKG
jgi:hypothetical protein